MLQIEEFALEELLHPKTVLAQLYHDKLPQKGWAGRLTLTEKEFVRLVKSARHRRKAV